MRRPILWATALRPTQHRLRLLGQLENRRVLVHIKGDDDLTMLPKKFLDVIRGTVASAYPDYFRWKPSQKASFAKIRVLRYDGVIVVSCVIPYFIVACTGHAHRKNVERFGVYVR